MPRPQHFRGRPDRRQQRKSNWRSFAILHDDAHILAVSKPEGLLVNMAENDELTLQDQIRKHTRMSTESDAVKPSAVHRLDRYTSGVVLFGKTKRGLEGLSRLLREGEIEKRYYALSVGVPEAQSGTIEIPLREVTQGKKRMLPVRDEREDYLDCTSSFELVEVLPAPDTPFDFALLELSPLTGRKHQLRVHMAEIGYPIAGDTIYGLKAPNRMLREKARLSRHFLHARSLKFTHPVTGHKISVEAKMPKDIVGVLKWLRAKREEN